jgi:hypothetical protein
MAQAATVMLLAVIVMIATTWHERREELGGAIN